MRKDNVTNNPPDKCFENLFQEGINKKWFSKVFVNPSEYYEFIDCAKNERNLPIIATIETHRKIDPAEKQALIGSIKKELNISDTIAGIIDYRLGEQFFMRLGIGLTDPLSLLENL